MSGFTFTRYDGSIEVASVFDPQLIVKCDLSRTSQKCVILSQISFSASIEESVEAVTALLSHLPELTADRATIIADIARNMQHESAKIVEEHDMIVKILSHALSALGFSRENAYLRQSAYSPVIFQVVVEFKRR